MDTHELCCIDKKYAGIGLEVNPLCFLDHFQALDRDISLICQAETDQLQHFDQPFALT